jgi:hypothetical protein
MKSDNNNGYFALSVSAHRNDWLGNPESGSSQPVAKSHRESFVITPSLSQKVPDTPATHRSMVPEKSDVSDAIHKAQR